MIRLNTFPPGSFSGFLSPPQKRTLPNFNYIFISGTFLCDYFRKGLLGIDGILVLLGATPFSE